MNKCLSIVFAAVVLNSSLQAETSNDHPLKWLDSTSAETAFLVDRDAGNLRFYVTYGNSTFIPSVGHINHARCYGNVKLTHLRAMTDQPNDMKEKILNDKAAIFSQEYNKLMQAYLDQQGLRTCSINTDWDEMAHQLFLFVSGESQTAGTGKVYEHGKPKITIEIKDINRLEEVSVFACKNLIQYGIFEKVEVVIYEWLPEQNHKKIERKSFSCINGDIEDV